MGAVRAAGVALLVAALLGALGVGALALVHGSVEPVLVAVAGLGLVGAVLVVVGDSRRAPGG